MNPSMLKIAALAAALSLAPATAQAQVGDSRLPVEINADHAESLDSERRLMYVGNVRATQGSSQIIADRMDVYFTGNGEGEGVSGWGNIQRIVVTGNVFYTTPTQRARGDVGTYLLTDETVTLTGDVVITQGENTITTDRFQTNLATGDSSFGDSENNERVRMVLFPQSNDDAAADDTPDEDPSR